MITLENLEKKINSELTTKIKESKIKHEQVYIDLDKKDSYFLLSNANVTLVKTHFSKYNTEIIDCKRAIHSKNPGAKAATSALSLIDLPAPLTVLYPHHCQLKLLLFTSINSGATPRLCAIVRTVAFPV